MPPKQEITVSLNEEQMREIRALAKGTAADMAELEQWRKGEMRKYCDECGHDSEYVAEICRECAGEMVREALTAAESRWEALRGWLDKCQNEHVTPSGHEASAIEFDEVFAKMAELEKDKS